MLAIWGTDALSLKIYARLSEEDRKQAFLVASSAHQDWSADGLHTPPRIIELRRLPCESAHPLPRL